LIGQNLGHYRIVGELGSGGMGTLYLAEDAKLGRSVALKVLPADAARDPDRRARFLREARAVAALNHPNIVVIHSVEEDREIPFITMEHVAGRRLSQLIPAEGMRLREFFAVAVPLADAVNGAHRQGVTHRDLKPDNVMINDEGRVKVLDFGLAKLFESAPVEPGLNTMTVADVATREGRILGTAAYMSPEQAEGRPLDARTDIFSLGVILFEMLTGRRPFTGTSQVSTLSAVLRDTPPGVNEVKPELPRHLGRIVSRCLAKEPDRRYQTALDVRNELEGLRDEVQSDPGASSAPESGMSPVGVPGAGVSSASGSWAGQPASSASTPPSFPGQAPSTTGDAGPRTGRGGRALKLGAGALAVVVIAAAAFLGLRNGREDAQGGRGAFAGAEAKQDRSARSIVVLPFENLGPPEDAYFAAGVTDEIMSRLANVSGLTVLSRTTSIQYDKTGKTMRQIGRDLGVGYVLEGTVRWEKLAGGTSRVRVVPQLIRTADDKPVWSDRYEESMDEIFRIQSTISSRVVDALGVTLLEPARMALNTRLTENMDAYHAYLKALEYAEGVNLDEPTIRMGIDLLSRAVELDPDFIVAQAMLAKQHAGLVHFGYDSTPARLALAEAGIARVGALGPDSPWLAYARGWVAYWGRKDLDAAVAHMERVRLELPGSVDVLEAIGFIRRRQGRYEEGLQSLQQAVDKDPRNSRLLWGVAETNCLLDRFDRALAVLDEVISLSPDAGIAYRLKAETHLAKADFVQAQAWLDRAPTAGDPLDIAQQRFELAFLRGDRAAAVAAAGAMPDLATSQFTAHSAPLSAGLAKALLGERAAADAAFGEALAVLERAVAATPNDSRLRSSLALAYAGVGDREAALREARIANETYPATHDKWIRSSHDAVLGYALMLLGDADAAVAQWKAFSESPGVWLPSRELLRVSPVFDSLRGSPEFGKLYANAD
jgi:serine/threonine-protein kinase